MRILKSINNNIVSAVDTDGQEIVVIGKGIGYRAQKGAAIPEPMVEKVFRMSSQKETDRLKELFGALPQDHIEVSNEIIAYAAEHLGKRLNESIYITLTDHISFSINRFKQGMNFHSALLSEIRQFYPEEYEVGKYGLRLIEERTAIRLPDEEAASVALHIINAEYDTSMSDSFHITRLMEQILSLVRQETGLPLQEQTYYEERFLTHLKYLTSRIIKKKPLPEGDDVLYSLMLRQYPQAVAVAKKAAEYVLRENQYHLTPEEIACLAIHLKKMM